MTFLLRTFMALVGAAFAIAVANLYISGVPQRDGAAVELAAADAASQPGFDELASDVSASSDGYPFVSTLLHLLFPDHVAEPQAITALRDTPAPTPLANPAAIPLTTPPTTAPPSAGGSRPEEAAPLVTLADYDAIAATWRDWLQAYGIEAGAMAIILPNGTEYGTGLGRAAEDMHPIMSLSKSITGLCVDQLLLEAGLGWDTTLGDIAAQMSAAGLTPRPGNDHITLASLVTHTSGLAPDLTQSNMARDTHGALGLHRRWAAAALQMDAITGEPGTYFYSNTNYAVLGVVVEALSGQTYAQACMDRIVVPAGVTDAVIEGRFGSLSSYGGWEMSAIDHARLVQHWFGPDQPHMADTRPDFDGYVLGYFDDGTFISHTGRFCRNDHPTGGVGSVFVHNRDGTVFSANWDACVAPATSDVLTSQIRDLL